MQNFVDLGSEIPGLVLAPIVCAAIVVGGTAGRDSRWGLDRWTRSPRAVALGGTIAGSLAIAVALSAMSGELNEDRAALQHAAAAGRGAADDLHALARAAMLGTPPSRICPSP